MSQRMLLQKKLIIHSGSLGTGQKDLKSVIVVIRQNSQVAVMARAEVTVREITSMATKALIVTVEERSSVLVHFFKLSKNQTSLK